MSEEWQRYLGNPPPDPHMKDLQDVCLESTQALYEQGEADYLQQLVKANQGAAYMDSLKSKIVTDTKWSVVCKDETGGVVWVLAALDLQDAQKKSQYALTSPHSNAALLAAYSTVEIVQEQSTTTIKQTFDMPSKAFDKPPTKAVVVYFPSEVLAEVKETGRLTIDVPAEASEEEIADLVRGKAGIMWEYLHPAGFEPLITRTDLGFEVQTSKKANGFYLTEIFDMNYEKGHRVRVQERELAEPIVRLQHKRLVAEYSRPHGGDHV